MSVFALTSVSGAPGVTTTCVAWAALSGTPTLVVEADTTGGSAILAGVFAGTVPHDRSVVDLATRDPEEYADRLLESSYPLPGSTHRWVVPAIATPAQAVSMQAVWTPLGRALGQVSDRGVDVVIDLGRWSTADNTAPLLGAADMVLLLTRTNLPALNALRVVLPGVRARLEGSGLASRLAVVPVTGGADRSTAHPYTTREISGITTPTGLMPHLPHAPRAAEVYGLAAAAHRTHEHSGYVRQVRRLIDAARNQAAANRDVIAS